MTVLKELVAALESGKYEQTREGYLEGVTDTGKPLCCAIGTLILERGGESIYDSSAAKGNNRLIRDSVQAALKEVDVDLPEKIIEWNDEDYLTFEDIASNLREAYPDLT